MVVTETKQSEVASHLKTWRKKEKRELVLGKIMAMPMGKKMNVTYKLWTSSDAPFLQIYLATRQKVIIIGF